MLTSLHLHMKSSEVSIKTRSTPASLTIQDQVTKHTTVKWPIARELMSALSREQTAVGTKSQVVAVYCPVAVGPWYLRGVTALPCKRVLRLS